MALTLAQILALPTQTRPRLIKAPDRGGAIYQIEEGAAGSTATPVIPNNNDARSVMGLGSGDSVSFGALTVAGNALQVTGASAINQDLRTTASPTWAGASFSGPITSTTGNSSLQSTNVTVLTIQSSARLKQTGGVFNFRNVADNADAQITFGGGTSSGPVTITDTTASSSPTTGALVVAGGIGSAGFIRASDFVAAGQVTAGSASYLSTASRARWYSPNANLWRASSNGTLLDIDLEARNATLSGSLSLPRTVIPPGTTGAQTINTATGKVRFAAGASTLVVTNSLATVNSIIFPNLDSADLTAKYAEITPANGSFTIRLNAAATAECVVSFGILTP